MNTNEFNINENTELLFAIGGWRGSYPKKLIETYDARADRWNRVSTKDPLGPRGWLSFFLYFE